jgi:hypothetical protein
MGKVRPRRGNNEEAIPCAKTSSLSCSDLPRTSRETGCGRSRQSRASTGNAAQSTACSSPRMHCLQPQTRGPLWFQDDARCDLEPQMRRRCLSLHRDSIHGRPLKLSLAQERRSSNSHATHQLRPPPASRHRPAWGWRRVFLPDHSRMTRPRSCSPPLR